MSSPDENAPKTDTEPRLDAAKRPARRAARPEEPKPAGRKALEQALLEAGKELKDLT
ncbi:MULTISPECIES: hypothetical protein [Nonomuraea]|uniref:hypothetical protein n=1 Tax=Nonomuraea TaxID=83681 RepID=UPI001378AAC9|nr:MULTISPECIES: hypothetical protein [Nonomuraea]NBE96620.1 hypothetical protein [Nonomuraea sp. K271]